MYFQYLLTVDAKQILRFRTLLQHKAEKYSKRSLFDISKLVCTWNRDVF